MATLRAVLGRHDEQLNLRSISLCVVLVIVLVSLAFGLLTFRPLFQDTPDKNRVESHAGEVQGTN
jgi:hypothetical protein